MDKNILEKIKTPDKVNKLLIKPSYQQGDFDSHAVDIPFPFYHDGKYYMTYVGWDTVGYRTGIAESEDLLNWEKKGIILDRGPEGSITEYNAALTSIIRENDLFSPGRLKKVKGRYVGTYHAYPKPGYETGPAVIGLCYSDNLFDWEISEPILIPDKDHNWESGGLYKSWIMEHDGTYFLFYNAKNRDREPWIEQIGVAISADLKHWERYESNPILRVGQKGDIDDLFVADPCIFKYRNRWIMFYYTNSSDGHARESVAFSTDLLNWEKTNEILIDVGKSGSVDSLYAHKPGIIAKGNSLYHFYCAASPANKKAVNGLKNFVDRRGISVAYN